jgi:Skp family chaperone for outer membrane proteins
MKALIGASLLGACALYARQSYKKRLEAEAEINLQKVISHMRTRATWFDKLEALEDEYYENLQNSALDLMAEEGGRLVEDQYDQFGDLVTGVDVKVKCELLVNGERIFLNQ